MVNPLPTMPVPMSFREWLKSLLSEGEYERVREHPETLLAELYEEHHLSHVVHMQRIQQECYELEQAVVRRQALLDLVEQQRAAGAPEAELELYQARADDEISWTQRLIRRVLYGEES